MTNQLIDQWGSDKSPRELWAEWKRTKYGDEQIKEHIDNAHHNAHYECADQGYIQGQCLTAQAMIAYNEMIDERIERARRTWGMK